MSQPAAPVPARARAHIKDLIEEAKHQAETAPEPAHMFFSGMLSGLAASVEILDGGTAEKSLELMAQRLAAAIGQAYIDGKLPPHPPAGPADAKAAATPPVVKAPATWQAADHVGHGGPCEEQPDGSCPGPGRSTPTDPS
ncbi:hypothetical protein [Streptomyces sp. NPDC047000]|uniref:hypothetical protein n=1 Tax=Streptomyces sp. NPDC047000 TaxID=3155474 RepID=UPI0034041344